MLEAHLRDARVDAGVDRFEPRAGEIGLGVGQLDRRGTTVSEERATNAVPFLGRSKPLGGAFDGRLCFAKRIARLGNLDADAVFQSLPL